MTSITIRKLPNPTKERLRQRASRAGLSLEAYTRQILQAASEADTVETPNLADLAEACFGADNGVELELPPRGHNRAPVFFD